MIAIVTDNKIYIPIVIEDIEDIVSGTTIMVNGQVALLTPAEISGTVVTVYNCPVVDSTITMKEG